MRTNRIRRPKEHEELFVLLKDKEQGVFTSFKSVLVFAAALGFREKKRKEFKDSSEPIPITVFNEHHDITLMLSMALTEYNDVAFLRSENFEQVIKVFEEYAAGGLDYLSSQLDHSNIKASIESLMHKNKEDNFIDDMVKNWE